MSKETKKNKKLRERQIPRYHEVESIKTIIYHLFTTGLYDFPAYASIRLKSREWKPRQWKLHNTGNMCT